MKNFRKISKKIFALLVLLTFVPSTVLASGSFITAGTEGFSESTSYVVSLAFDSDNDPYVVYRDSANSSKALVKEFDGENWNTVGGDFATAGYAGGPSIAIDSNDTPYIAYLDAVQTDKGSVKKYNGSSWVVVGSEGFTSSKMNLPIIKLDSSDTPYVAYNSGASTYVPSVMKYNGSSWELVGSAGFSTSTANYLSFDISPSDTPYVSYSDGSASGKLTVQKYNATTTDWELVGPVGFSTSTAYYTSIAIDSNNTPYVAYRDGSQSEKITVQKYNGSNWEVVGSVGFSSASVLWSKIAIDSTDTPYVVYHDDGNSSKATLQKFDGTDWVIVGLAGFSDDQVDYLDLAINSDDVPYIAYQDDGNLSKLTVKYFTEDPTITYSGNFTEDIVNYDGTLDGNRVATIYNDTFVNSGSILTLDTHYSVSNMPAGLTPVMTVNGAGTTATLTFTGSATSNDPGDNVSNLTVTFLNGAFTSTATASNVTGYTNNVGTVTFYTDGQRTNTVNSLLDDGDGVCDSGGCTFRDAIETAEEGERVEFDDSLTGTITLTEVSDIIIDEDLTIAGPGSDVISVDFGGSVSSLDHTGGDLVISGLTITNGDNPVYENIDQEGTLTITNVTFDSNEGDGALYVNNTDSVTINNSIFSNNDGTSSQEPSAINWNSSGTLTINDTTFYNNTSENAYGGAMNLYGADEITISDSTFYDNSNPNGGWGGVFYMESTGSLTIENSTFYNNSADYGGAIYVYDYDIYIINSTFYGNTADSEGDNFWIDDNPITISNSIIESSNDYCYDGYEDIISLGYNIDTTDSCGFDQETDATSTDPLLDTVNLLADNGGNVKTIALLEGSPAIDAGDDTQAPDTDARGVSRPQGSASDIGAYEFAVTFNITSSAGSRGSISPLGSTAVARDDDQTYTITPDAGYMVSDVLVDSVSVGAVSSYTFSSVTEDHTISATFVANPNYDSNSEPVIYGYYPSRISTNRPSPNEINTIDVLEVIELVSTSTPEVINNISSSSGGSVRDLKTGDKGGDVQILQKVLNTTGYALADEGPGSPGNETDFFGQLTREAVIRFQQERGVEPAVGYFGPLTRTALVTYILELIAGE